MQTKDRKMLKPENGASDKTKTAQKGAKPTTTEKEATASQNKADKSGDEPESKPVVIPMKPTPINAGDRLSRFEQFQKLGERYAFLKDKDRELKNFQVSQDGTLAKITLDCPGCNVLISNSTIIEKVVNLCQAELTELLSKTEKEVIEFEI